MGFNEVALLIAVAAGGLAAWTGTIVRVNERADLAAAIAVGVVLSAVGTGAFLLGDGLPLAAMHVAYLIAVVGVPLAAVVLLVRRRWSRAATVGLALAIVPLPVGVYATHIEPFWLRVDRVTLESADVSAPIRIGVLADLQTPSIGSYEMSVIDRLIAEQPDVVLMPGDVFSFGGEAFGGRFDEFAEVMTRLDDAVSHVVVVNGNVDSLSGIRRLVENTDIHLLDDTTTTFDVADTRVRVLGVTLHHRPSLLPAAPTIEPDDGVLQIVLAHQPDEIERFRGNESVDLVVAGHTHGGQISIPFFGPPYTLSSVPRHVAAGGLNEMYGIPIYVSTGVGRERGRAPQVRFNVRPSIGIIDVVPTG